jgi:hypothetical protein
MTARVAKPKVADPAASPSRPSVRFTALAVAAMITVAHTTQSPVPRWMPSESKRVKERLVEMWAQYTDSRANPRPRAIWAPNLARLFKPRLRRWRTLIQSSANPINDAPSTVNNTRIPEGETWVPGIARAAKYPMMRAMTMPMPPMVGVPALAMWTWGPSSRICWPMLFLISQPIRTGVRRAATTKATPPEVINEIIEGSRHRGRPGPGGPRPDRRTG